MIEGAIYVPFQFVMESLGAKYSWNSRRELATATLLRPAGSMFKAQKGKITIRSIVKQDDEWYHSDQASQVVQGILANQNDDGGWFKLGSSDDLSAVIDRDLFPNYRQKSTIDNDSTTVQMDTLARVYSIKQDAEIKESLLKGIKYLIDGQYENGGWPQFFPQTVGYHQRITFNDNAVSNVLELLQKVADKSGDYSFVSDDLAAQASAAVDRGLRLILDTQIVANGAKTAWCAQYDEETLECARGRSYELAAISGDESVNIIRFLMSYDEPHRRLLIRSIVRLRS